MTDGLVRILCFGDSNTWGYSPKDGARYSVHVRWTGVLQSLLGNDYQLIEEGLNGRTTDLDYSNRYGRNGRSYLIPCLDSHAPLDYVILNLGANDTKIEFARSPENICAAIQEGAGIYGDRLMGATRKVATLATLYHALAMQYGLLFVDLSHIAPSPIDGVHLSEEAHQTIARTMYETIRRQK